MDDELTTSICLNFRACKDVIVKLLDKNELTRLGSKSGASEVKQHKWFSKINWGLLRNTQPPVSFVFKGSFLHTPSPTRAGASPAPSAIKHVAFVVRIAFAMGGPGDVAVMESDDHICLPTWVL